MGEEKAVPKGRLGRIARLATLGLKTGAGFVMRQTDAQVADRAAEVLGNMRGLAAKVGQMASYVDGLVPEDKRDAFEKSLKVLRTQAPRSKPEAIRAVVEEELGAPIEKLFSRWDAEPLASASIGQVHRAALLDGTEVAVKVQHPGIRKAVESDLASAKLLESLAAVTGARRFDTDVHLETMRARFREELDYALEGERLVAFRALHEGDPMIVVPRFFPEQSSKSVLTTELVEGTTLEEAMREPEDVRRAYAETLWRYVFKGNLVGGMFNADPHPGNYVFQGGGRIAFLDYGCVQVIPPERRPLARALHRAAVSHDKDAFDTAVSALLDAKPGTEMEKQTRAYSRLCFEPLFSAPYRITREYAASLVSAIRAMGMVTRKLPDDQIFSMPAEMLFMNRLQFGFYSVLARLDVAVDYAKVESAFLPST